jgi:hypothetical protein
MVATSMTVVGKPSPPRSASERAVLVVNVMSATIGCLFARHCSVTAP